MMKFVFFAVFLAVFAHGVDGFMDSIECATCHRIQTNFWKKSRHANHDSELYIAVLEAVAKQTDTLKIEVLSLCSRCHNPELAMNKNLNTYMFSKILGIKNSVTREIDEVAKSTSKISNVSCSFCHSIDSIKPNPHGSLAGSELVEWIKEKGTFSGPFASSANEFHKNVQKDVFKSDQICLACHNQVSMKDKNGKPLIISAYTTGDEMVDLSKSCTDCHMSEIQKNFSVSGSEIAELRGIREHRFTGGHDISQVRSAFLYEYDKESKSIFIQNTSPHMVPTGFGGRLLEFVFSYEDKKGNTLDQSETRTFGAHYKKNGRPALQYLADSMQDERLKGLDKKQIKLNPPKDAYKVNIKINYHFISPELIKEYDLKISPKAAGPMVIEYQNGGSFVLE